MNGNHVLVIGGGVIGTASAYYLADDGWQVTLVDRGCQGEGCSDGNCGLLAYSHVLPLNEPGAVGHALAALCRSRSPLYIKPRLDPRLWGWLLRFARQCNRGAMIESARALEALIRSSAVLFDRLLESESIDCERERRGCLFVYRTQVAMDAYAETERLLRETFATPATRYDGKALNALEPALKPGLAGGWHYASDGHLRPERLLAGWRRALEDRGVTIREHCGVEGFVRRGDRAVAARTEAGEIPAEAFVVATGALAPRLEKELGCRLAIQPGKGYSITMPRPQTCPAIPMLFQEHKVAVTPMQSGYRLGSTMEFSGYDESLNPRRLDLLTDAAALYLVDPVAEPIQKTWYGWRPMTCDGRPMIDRVPAMSNVYLAAGHNMLGLTLAPATGKLVAELVGGRTPHIDPRPYAVNR
jgi:D-amino-acid dehydrogenase